MKTNQSINTFDKCILQTLRSTVLFFFVKKIHNNNNDNYNLFFKYLKWHFFSKLSNIFCFKARPQSYSGRMQSWSSAQLTWTAVHIVHYSLKPWIRDLFVFSWLITEMDDILEQMSLVMPPAMKAVTAVVSDSPGCESVCGTAVVGFVFQLSLLLWEVCVLMLCVFCVHSMVGAPCTWLPTKATLRLSVSCSKLAVTWTSKTMWVKSSICQLCQPYFSFIHVQLLHCSPDGGNQWNAYLFALNSVFLDPHHFPLTQRFL